MQLLACPLVLNTVDLCSKLDEADLQNMLSYGLAALSQVIVLLWAAQGSFSYSLLQYLHD